MFKKIFSIVSILIVYQTINAQIFIRDTCEKFNVKQFSDSMIIVLDEPNNGMLFSYNQFSHHIQHFKYSLSNCDSVKQKACLIIIEDVDIESSDFYCFCPQDTLVYGSENVIYFIYKPVRKYLEFKRYQKKYVPQFFSKALKEQVDSLICMIPDNKKIIDVYVYGRDSTYIVLSLSSVLHKHFYNVSSTYSNHIIHYGGLCDSLAREYINLDIFNKSDSSKCGDYMNYIVEPPMFYMFVAQKDSMERISPSEKDWSLFDAFYYEKYGEHIYHPDDISLPEPE